MLKSEYRRNKDYQTGTSYPEQFFLRTLKQLYEIEHRRIEPDLGLEFDITIMELNLRLEYSGDYWHMNKQDKDEKRRKYCKDNAINYIEIIERQGKKDIEVYKCELHTKIYVYTTNEYVKKNEKLIAVLEYILKQFGHMLREIDIDRAVCESFASCKKYNYVIIRRNGKIVGTQDKVYWTDLNYADYVIVDINDNGSKKGLIVRGVNDFDSNKNTGTESAQNEDSTIITNKTLSERRYNM